MSQALSHKNHSQPDGTPRPGSVETGHRQEERGTVWIVDDSPLEAEMAKRAVSAGYDVKLFAEGTMMLEQLASGPGPDTLILDWQLPGMNGIDVCRFLRG